MAPTCIEFCSNCGPSPPSASFDCNWQLINSVEDFSKNFSTLLPSWSPSLVNFSSVFMQQLSNLKFGWGSSVCPAHFVDLAGCILHLHLRSYFFRRKCSWPFHFTHDTIDLRSWTGVHDALLLQKRSSYAFLFGCGGVGVGDFETIAP